MASEVALGRRDDGVVLGNELVPPLAKRLIQIFKLVILPVVFRPTPFAVLIQRHVERPDPLLYHGLSVLEVLPQIGIQLAFVVALLDQLFDPVIALLDDVF